MIYIYILNTCSANKGLHIYTTMQSFRWLRSVLAICRLITVESQKVCTGPACFQRILQGNFRDPQLLSILLG